jgi:hypothetical protein
VVEESIRSFNLIDPTEGTERSLPKQPKKRARSFNLIDRMETNWDCKTH